MNKTDKITTLEIENRVASFFDYRQNIIVPNISWGINIHECDLLIIRKSGCGIEVEIKISKADLKKDGEKRHGHFDYNNRIKELYFAIPEHLKDNIDLIPERAGILVLNKRLDYGYHIDLRILRKPKSNMKATKFTEKEILKIAHLGTMRIWNLKRNIIETRRKLIGVQLPLKLHE
jgi:hypothetical protein